MEIKLSLTEELRPFKHSHFRQFYMIGYVTCVIISSHSFQWIVFKPCVQLINILKLCIWRSDEEKINIDKFIIF